MSVFSPWKIEVRTYWTLLVIKISSKTMLTLIKMKSTNIFMLSLFTCLPKLFLNFLSPCHLFQNHFDHLNNSAKKIMSPSGHSNHLCEFINAYGVYNWYMFNTTLWVIEKNNKIIFTYHTINYWIHIFSCSSFSSNIHFFLIAIWWNKAVTSLLLKGQWRKVLIQEISKLMIGNA